MSIAVKSGLPSLGSTEGAVISADEVSVSEDGSAAASVGEDLPRGKSAYEIAKENGFNGTETEWLASLKGATGAPGADGKDGTDGKTPYVGDNGNWYIGTDDTGKPSRGAKGEPGSPGAKGDKGDPGATPNLTIGTVTTLEAGESATASMGGTAESPVLNLGIPRGAKGEPGQGGGGGGTYYVELDGNYPDLTLSETTPLADIAAAYNEGKALFCRLSTAYHTVSLPLLMYLTELNIWIFSGSGGAAAMGFPAQYFTIVVSAQGVAAENEMLVQTDAIVTTVSASSTNAQVPSAKCVYDELQKRSLKQATSDTLGGVKADPATADDTQPVRIGGDGKLYTAPCDTDISLGLTSAAVGQTIKVKAIDESGKPTEWEAADMAGGAEHWEKIADIDLRSDTSKYVLADFGVWRKAKVIMTRPKFISGLKQNVWVKVVKKGSISGYNCGYIESSYGYVYWEFAAEVDDIFISSTSFDNNNPNIAAAIKSPRTLTPLDGAPSEYEFILLFTDTSVIQEGDRVTVIGVKR